MRRHVKSILSEALARALLENGCDRAKVYSHDKSSYEIAGVFQDYKHRNYEQPYPLLVWVYNEIQGKTYMNWSYSITFR